MGQDAERGIGLDREGEAEPEGQHGAQGVDAAADQIEVVDVERRPEVRGQGAWRDACQQAVLQQAVDRLGVGFD